MNTHTIAAVDILPGDIVLHEGNPLTVTELGSGRGVVEITGILNGQTVTVSYPGIMYPVALA